MDNKEKLVDEYKAYIIEQLEKGEEILPYETWFHLNYHLLISKLYGGKE